MGTALITLAAFGGLVALLLAVPLRVAFHLERVEAFNGQISVGWMFGLARFRLQLPRKTTASKRAPAGPDVERRTKSKRRGAPGNVVVVLRQGAFRQRLFRFMKDIVAATHLRDLRLRTRLGLGDPADTGRLWALLGPLDAAARNLQTADVRIEPEFVDEVFEFRASGRLLLIPLQILLLAIGFALSPASMRAWRTLKGSRA